MRPGSRTRAVLVVTGLALAAGAALGLLTMGGILLAAIVSGRSWTARDVTGLLMLSAGWGAVFGLALGPLTAFGLLRAVPLGRAILWTALGALGGLAAAFVLGAHPLVAIPVGFLAGALYARHRHGRPTLAAGESQSRT